MDESTEKCVREHFDEFARTRPWPVALAQSGATVAAPMRISGSFQTYA